MSAPQELGIDVDWGSLSALTWRNPGAPRTLCLHGWLDNAASFTPLARYLDRLDLVALEFAGHGHSGHRPRGAWYYLSDYVFDIDASLDALGWDDCTIIGHSMGASVACVYAAAEPERVKALVMIDAAGPVTESETKAASRIRKSIKSVREPRQHKRVYADLEGAARARQANMSMSDRAARLLAERALRRNGDGYRWRTDHRLMWTSPFLLTEAQSREIMGNLACPVMVLVTPVLRENLGAIVDQRIELVPRHRVVDIDGGHHVHMDDPGTVAPHIIEFLSATGNRP